MSHSPTNNSNFAIVPRCVLSVVGDNNEEASNLGYLSSRGVHLLLRSGTILSLQVSQVSQRVSPPGLCIGIKQSSIRISGNLILQFQVFWCFPVIGKTIILRCIVSYEHILRVQTHLLDFWPKRLLKVYG